MKKKDEIKLVIHSNGDPSVGIPSYTDTVTISFEYGGLHPETKEDLVKDLKSTLGEFFEGRAYTPEEWEKLIEETEVAYER